MILGWENQFTWGCFDLRQIKRSAPYGALLFWLEASWVVTLINGPSLQGITKNRALRDTADERLSLDENGKPLAASKVEAGYLR